MDSGTESRSGCAAHRRRLAERASEVEAGAVAVGDLVEGVPDAELEDSPSQVQGIYPAPAFGQIAALAHALERRIDEPRE